MENQKREEGEDCYGFLYEPNFQVCRGCPRNLSCLDTVRKNIAKDGESVFREKQRRIIMANDPNTPEAISASPQNVTPEMSETVAQAIEVCKQVGLRPLFKSGYIAFKLDNNANLLCANRMKAKDLKGLIHFIKLQDREAFPEDARQFISEDRIKGSLYFTGTTLEELEFTLRQYIEFFKSSKK